MKAEIDPSASGVFIRAPRITRVGDGAKVLALWQGDPVLVQKGPILGACFHPELQASQFSVLAHDDFVQAFNVIILKRQAALQFIQS